MYDVRIMTNTDIFYGIMYYKLHIVHYTVHSKNCFVMIITVKKISKLSHYQKNRYSDKEGDYWSISTVLHSLSSFPSPTLLSENS